MRTLTRIISVLVLSCSFVFLAHAATDNFTLQLLVGGDTTPPSTPTGLTATGVSLSQIDLSWASSTDNYILSGYHVWRDGALIATTSATTYSDVGLASSTSYLYYVTAYDSYFNESASSTMATGTTLTPPPPTPPASGSGSATWIRPPEEQLKTIEILPQKDSVIIRYTTYGHVRTVVRWGRGISYELGSIAESTFSTSHETKITGLIPDTTYTFVIEGENSIGRQGVLYTGTFTTLPPDDIFPPDNVIHLTAIKDGADVVLSWENPQDSDFAKVRVVRSDLFYPSDIADGWVVYEGMGTGVRDESAAVGTYQYYTVFSYDTLGNISSGAVVSVYVGTTTEGIPPDHIDETKNEIELTLSDILFTQDGITIEPIEGNIEISGAKKLTIAIPYEVLPEHLKTILVTIGDSMNEERTFKFILRVNEERTFYTGTLAPFGISGHFPVTVSVFDFKTSQIGYAKGTLVSHIRSIHKDSEPSAVVGFLGFLTFIGESYILWFVLLLILLAFVSRRLMHTRF